MEKATIQEVNKQQEQGFDEETKHKLQAFLEEIDAKRLQQQQSLSSLQQTKYIKFVQDKESKLLSFTGKCDKVEVPAKDFETGQTIPDKYVERYSFECYDISDPDHPSELSVWQRGIREARTLLYFLSKSKTILEVTRNGPPGSKTTTYQINPPLD
jgi:hypothetical protein